MSEKRKPRPGVPNNSLADISSPLPPRDASTGLFPPLSRPVRHLAVDGLPYPVFCPERIVKNSELFEGREGDVIVATYPRSGTSLTLSICRELHLLHNTNLPKDHPFFSSQHQMQQTPWIHTEFTDTSSLDKMPSPRVFKTHNYYRHLNIDSKLVKVIHVFRNPKDVACSHYHHVRRPPLRHFFDFEGSFLDFVGWFLKGGFETGCYWEFNKDYLRNEDHHQILHLTYEELSLDKGAAIRRINDFLGYENLDEKEVAFVDRATSLDPERLRPNQVGKPGQAMEMLSFEQRSWFDDRTRKEFEEFEGIPGSYTDEELYLNQR